MSFAATGISERLEQGIKKIGYKTPTEIQSQAIPQAIEGQDIIGCAQTGTGKTAAFVLPTLHRLSQANNRPKGKAVRALVLTPTRELAVQIEKSIQTYGHYLRLRSLAVYGGADIKKQIGALRGGVDLVVATPGRLMDHMERRTIDLKKVEILVLDEADRMLDMGFIHDVRRIIRDVPKQRQTLLFSATISKAVKALGKDIQKSPKMVQAGPVNNPVKTINQCAYKIEHGMKQDFLLHLLKTTSMESVLVFLRTKRRADRLQRRLARENVPAVAMHSDRSQSQRQKALAGFKKGRFSVMVATDIAARGIDVTGISHVINYDLPRAAEDYVHRIGRTGRAEADGDAIAFVTEDEKNMLAKIERFIKRKLHLKQHRDFESAKKGNPDLKTCSGESDRLSKKRERRKVNGKHSGRKSSRSGRNANRKRKHKKNN